MTLSALVALGVATFFLVETIRILPYVNRWTHQGIRPFACHLCMSLWTSLVLVAFRDGFRVSLRDLWSLAPSWLSVGGICLALLYFFVD